VHPREFHGEAAEGSSAPLEECFGLLAAVERYPDWCGEVIRDVEVRESGADGQPTQVRMTVHVARGPIEREFNLFLAVATEPPQLVKLTRVTDHPTNQEFNATWLLGVRPGETTLITLQLDALLRVPWYMGGRGVGDAIAQRFVEAACAALAGA
jgi:hypothetical protein